MGERTRLADDLLDQARALATSGSYPTRQSQALLALTFSLQQSLGTLRTRDPDLADQLAYIIIRALAPGREGEEPPLAALKETLNSRWVTLGGRIVLDLAAHGSSSGRTVAKRLGEPASHVDPALHALTASNLITKTPPGMFALPSAAPSQDAVATARVTRALLATDGPISLTRVSQAAQTARQAVTNALALLVREGLATERQNRYTITTPPRRVDPTGSLVNGLIDNPQAVGVEWIEAARDSAAILSVLHQRQGKPETTIREDVWNQTGRDIRPATITARLADLERLGLATPSPVLKKRHQAWLATPKAD